MTVEPLSEAFLVTVEQHYTNPSSDMRRLVAEVRSLRAVIDLHNSSAHCMALQRERDDVRSVLNDLLLTRQAQEDASGEHFDRLLADDGSPEDAQRCEEASDREAKATLAHEAAWDRAHSLLAREEKP